MPDSSNRASTSLKVGPDEVWFLSKKLVIYALREIPDWEVRGFQRNAIYFQGQKYYLVDISPGKPPHAVRYELAPWPDDFHDESKISFTYDEAFVAERDHCHKADRHEVVVHNLLLPFFPLLGFCWSGFKERVLTRYGFGAVTVTGASLLLLWAIFLMEATFFFVFHIGLLEIMLGSDWPDYALVIVLPLDCSIRYGQILHHHDYPDGFLEWAFKWLRRPRD